MKIAKGRVRIVVEFTVDESHQFNELYKDNAIEEIQDSATEKLFGRFPSDIKCNLVNTHIDGYEEVESGPED